MRSPTATGLFLYIVAAAVLIVTLALLAWMFINSPHTVFVRTGQTLEQSGVVLSQTQNILNLVALLLTIATALGSLFAVFLSLYVRERLAEIKEQTTDARTTLTMNVRDSITETEKRLSAMEEATRDAKLVAETLERQVSERERHVLTRVSNEIGRSHEFVRTALVSIAEMVQGALPRMTLSQQVPIGVVRTVEPIYNIAGNGADYTDFEDWLDRQQNGARIRFAQALYLLGREPVVVTAHYEKTLLLLTKALKVVKDKTLAIDIQMRLFQTLRQLRRYDAADALLRDVSDGSERLRLLGCWGAMVLHLQRGFDETGEKRRMAFARAAEIAAVLVRTPRWPVDAATHPNVAYYCAKALWAFRLSRSSATEVATIADFRSVYSSALRAASEGQNRLAAQSGTDDMLQAVYCASASYVALVRRYACRDDVDDDVPHGEEGVIVSCLERAEQLVKDTAMEGYSVYDEHSERLGAPVRFAEYLNTLRCFLDDPRTMPKFYACGAV